MFIGYLYALFQFPVTGNETKQYDGHKYQTGNQDYYQCAQPDDHILFARKCVNDLLAFVILAFQYVQFVLCRHCFYRIGPDDEVLVSAGHQ